MAKREKTLKDLDLREVVSKVGEVSAYINMYADNRETLDRVLTHSEFTQKLFDNVAQLKLINAELQKRFNAPVGYEEENVAA